MLMQILNDMFIDPDLLAELSDEQKQILFLKMREEQVRRWKEYDEKIEKEEKKKNKSKHHSHKSGRNIGFLKGRDGDDWVWVMGEHKNDTAITDILESEAHRKALKQAEKETEELRKKEEAAIQKKIEEEKKRLEEEREKILREQEEAALYQSIKEARMIAEKAEAERKKKEEEQKLKLKEMQEDAAVERRKSIQKMDNVKKRRSDEIYIRWKEMRQQLEKVAEETSQEVEKNWQEQEKKSKEAEFQMSLMAKKAREENRHSLTQASKLVMAANAFSSAGSGQRPPLPPKAHGSNAVVDKQREMFRKNRPTRPKNKEAVITWFHLEEKTKKTVWDPKKSKIAEWFHGVISRLDAEKLLLSTLEGSYLVRVSEKVWGYTISYRASDRCKHFLIDASEENYHFFGPNQLPHGSIHELVDFHATNPITVAGGEKLLYPRGQACDPPDYWELFQNRQTESTAF